MKSKSEPRRRKLFGLMDNREWPSWCLDSVVFQAPSFSLSPFSFSSFFPSFFFLDEYKFLKDSFSFPNRTNLLENKRIVQTKGKVENQGSRSASLLIQMCCLSSQHCNLSLTVSRDRTPPNTCQPNPALINHLEQNDHTALQKYWGTFENKRRKALKLNYIIFEMFTDWQIGLSKL